MCQVYNCRCIAWLDVFAWLVSNVCSWYGIALLLLCSVVLVYLLAKAVNPRFETPTLLLRIAKLLLHCAYLRVALRYRGVTLAKLSLKLRLLSLQQAYALAKNRRCRQRLEKLTEP